MENDKKARNFHNYKVWQDSVNLATIVYKTTAEMPWFEKKGFATNCKGQSLVLVRISQKDVQSLLMQNFPSFLMLHLVLLLKLRHNY